MSVIVENITKIYGKQRAVDKLSFEARPGEILGLLGPNGAGKTTTMKILTCFLPPSEGDAFICGTSIFGDQQKLRSSIGYLPEHNPLYKEMYVIEFLETVASIFKLADKRKRIDEIIEMTGLGREKAKKISSLSKGYRQRVGLAQALIHDPEVLILDEPTSGLDPNQLAEIRKLIKALGETKTIIFSSHILQEVTALCDRVVILNKGQLVANSGIDELALMKRNENVIRLDTNKQIDISDFKSSFSDIQIKAISSNAYEIRAEANKDIRLDLFDYVVSKGLKILTLNQESVSVEEIFQQLTNQTEEGNV